MQRTRLVPHELAALVTVALLGVTLLVPVGASATSSWNKQVTIDDGRELWAVKFVDADHGWVVGRQTDPETWDTTGFILGTADGGSR